MPDDVNQASDPSSQSTAITQTLDSSPEDIGEVFHDILGVKKRLSKLKSFFKTRRQITNGTYLFDFTANEIKQSDLMGPLTFNIYSSTIAATIALVVAKVFSFFFAQDQPNIVSDPTSVMGQFSKLRVSVEGYVRPFYVPVTFLFLAYLISWGTIRGTEPRFASISSDSLNKSLPSRTRGRNAFLYFDGAYGLIPQALLSLALTVIKSIPSQNYLTTNDSNTGFNLSPLIWVGVVPVIMCGGALIYQIYLTYYKYPTLLFKAHGYYDQNSTTRIKPPWFKYIFTVVFLTPVVTISTYLLFKATVSVIAFLLAVVLASLHPSVANHTEKQGLASSTPANVAIPNSNTDDASVEALNLPFTWHRIENCGGVTFYGPPDLHDENCQKFQSRDMRLEIDAATYPHPANTLGDVYAAKRDFHLDNLKINGQKAEIISYYEDNRVGHPARL
jgi:hypothetical protein